MAASRPRRLRERWARRFIVAGAGFGLGLAVVPFSELAGVSVETGSLLLAAIAVAVGVAVARDGIAVVLGALGMLAGAWQGVTSMAVASPTLQAEPFWRNVLLIVAVTPMAAGLMMGNAIGRWSRRKQKSE